MRIPTVLGLGVLILALGAGIVLINLHQKPQVSSDVSVPKNIEVVNISDTEAAIIWQTDKPTSGFVSFGESQALGEVQNDTRDKDNILPHSVHFVTLKDLKEDFTYYFKVRSGPYFYPDKPLSFKSAKSLSEDTKKAAQVVNKPLIGVVLNPDLSPADEALVLLKIEGAQTLASVTSKTGNFILSTAYLYKTNLSEGFILSQKITAILNIIKDNSATQIKITLPSDTPLPRIIVGQNADLTQIATSSSKIASPSASPSPKQSNPYDLNGDGRVNSLDLDIVLENVGRSSKDPKFNKAADLDGDGVVDQKDVDLMKQHLSQ